MFMFFFCQSMQFGATPMFFIMNFWSVSTFYAAQWEENETHVLRHAVACFGATERKSQIDCYNFV